MQSVNKSEDVYNDEIIVTKSRLQRNQSSVGQEPTIRLSSKEQEKRMPASSSDLMAGEKSIPLSHKQSFVYNESLGTAVEEANDEIIVKPPVLPEEIIIKDAHSSASERNKSQKDDSKEGTMIREFKVTNSS